MRQCLDLTWEEKPARELSHQIQSWAHSNSPGSAGSARRRTRNTHDKCSRNLGKRKANETLKSEYMLVVLFCSPRVFPVNLSPEGTLGPVSYLGPTRPSTARTLSKPLPRVNRSGQGMLSGLPTHDSRSCKHAWQ